MSIEELKKKFNYLLNRQKNGEAWMNKASENEQNEHFESYKKILLQLEAVRIELRKRGVTVTLDEC